jgi:3-oxoacyl-[acyl-carrier-protein] synthase-3
LIQKGLGINPLHDKENRTFSFDILNGSCGFLNAIQVAGAIMKSSGIRYTLIVSSDVHPSKKRVDDFPFRNIGAAALLEYSEDPGKGFQEILFRTSQDTNRGLEAIVDLSAKGARQNVKIKKQDDYITQLADFTSSTIYNLYLEAREKHDIRLDELILITSQPVRGFGNMVAKAAGLKGNPVGCHFEKYGDPHSSALTLGYHEARNSGKIGVGSQVVFIGASSGLTVSAGLYFV